MKYAVCLAVALVAAGAQRASGWPAAFPTGTTLYDPEKSYNGYTLFTALGRDSKALHLINMNGEVVHEWQPSFPIIHGRLLPNGNVLVVGSLAKPLPGPRPGFAPFWMGGAASVIAELAWDGTEVFTHVDRNMHHDGLKLANGNYLYVAWERVPEALREKVRGGVKGSEHRDLTGHKPGPVPTEIFEAAEKVMFSDVLVEVDAKGEVVWFWKAKGHLDPDIDIIGPIHTRQEWTHINTVNEMANGNIVVTCRQLDCLMVINKADKKVIFRWGSMSQLADPKTGEIKITTTLDTLSGPHSGAEVPPGTPGTGNFIVYDNGVVPRGPLMASRAMEIDPTTGDLVWQSTTIDENNSVTPFGRKHFSDFVGTAQKLPNGNVLMCEGANGRILQVTQDREPVWEYVNPFSSDEKFNGVIFKAHFYPPDYCPQFASLPPAKGTAVNLTATGTGSNNASANPQRLISIGTLAAIAGGAAVVAFLLGWTLRGKRAGAAMSAAATPSEAASSEATSAAAVNANRKKRSGSRK